MIRLSGSNFIAGNTSNESSIYYNSSNPITQEQSDIRFFEATKKEINRSVSSAMDAFQVMKELNDTFITSFLQEVSNQIHKIEDQLIEKAHWETGLPFQRLKNERIRTCKQLELFAEFLTKQYHIRTVIDTGDNTKKPFKPDIRKMLIPIGPVLVFPASNFPFAFGVCGGDTASAWAAKCPVIVKTHPLHPQTSELFAHAVFRAVTKSDMPNGCFSMIHARNLSSIKALITHPHIEAIGFTGSQFAGRNIFDIANTRIRPIPVYAEMGSINPVFITKKALKEKEEAIAKNLADSITLGVGQFCTKPGIICVPKGCNTFIKKITNQMQTQKHGVLLSKKTQLTLRKNVTKTAETKHVSCITGGHDIKETTSFEPTLFITDYQNYLHKKNLHSEHFGPVALIITYERMDELIKIIDGLDGQLTGTIYMGAGEDEKMKSVVSTLMQKVGRIIFNGVPTGVEVCYAMQHGGPYPATTAAHTTSVGMDAIFRFLRPIAFQNMPVSLLPKVLQNKNSLQLLRVVNKELTINDIESD
jgi:2,5-dioxopentanoate dehydrogenase